MMNLYLVTYDIVEGSSTDYANVLKAIRGEDGDDVRDYRKLGQSSYVVESALSETRLYDKLLDKLDTDDSLYIIVIAAIHGTAGAKLKWVQAHIPPDQLGAACGPEPRSQGSV